MSARQSLAEWRIIGETVPGASHLRAGTPNQDSILQLRESGRGLPLVLSVSDGHGSNKCFRSDRGSRFAVKKAAQLVGELLDELRGAPDLAELERRGREQLPREFVRRWREAVEADLKRRPFTPQELDALEQKDGAKARKLVESNPPLAYGATSLTIALEESFVLYLQLGDGEILTVTEAGEVARPLPDDARLFANETTSLCTPDAEQNFRFQLQKISDAPPALILLSTDGYVNSFSDEAGFLKVGSDLLEMLRSDGFDFVSENLKGWLEEATRMGSGDDTTLGIVCRMDALQKPLIAAAATTTGTATEAAAAAATTAATIVTPEASALPPDGEAEEAGGDVTPVPPQQRAAPAAASSEPQQVLSHDEDAA